jgi:hypothetical protein
VAMALSLAALIIATLFLLQREFMMDARGNLPIAGYGIGYWVWLSSIAVCCIGSLAVSLRRASPG